MKQHYTSFRVLGVWILTLISATLWAQETVTIDNLSYTIEGGDNFARLTGYTGTNTTIKVPTTFQYNQRTYHVTAIDLTANNTTVTTLDLSSFNDRNEYYPSTAGDLLNQDSHLTGLTALKTIYVDYQTYNEHKNDEPPYNFKWSILENAQITLEYTPDYAVDGKLRYMIENDKAIVVGVEPLGSETAIHIPQTLGGKPFAGFDIRRDYDKNGNRIVTIVFDGLLQYGLAQPYGPSYEPNEPRITEIGYIYQNVNNVQFSNISDYNRYTTPSTEAYNFNQNANATTFSYHKDEAKDGAYYTLGYTTDENGTIKSKYFTLDGMKERKSFTLLKTFYSDYWKEEYDVRGINKAENTYGNSDRNAKVIDIIIEGDYTQYAPSSGDLESESSTIVLDGETPCQGWGDDNVESYASIPFGKANIYCNDIQSAFGFSSISVSKLENHVFFDDNNIRYEYIYEHRKDIPDDENYLAVAGVVADVTKAEIPQNVKFNNTKNEEVVKFSNLLETKNTDLTELTFPQSFYVDTLHFRHYFPQLKKVYTPDYYKVIVWNNLLTSAPSETFDELSVEIIYTGEKKTEGNFAYAEYKDYAGYTQKVWIGFSGDAEEYVYINDNNGYVAGIVEPSENVTHLDIDLSSLSTKNIKNLYGLEGLRVRDHKLTVDDITELHSEGFNAIFIDKNSYEDGELDDLDDDVKSIVFDTSFENYVTTADDGIEGLTISGNLDEATVYGYAGSNSILDLSDGNVKYHNWRVPVRNISSITNPETPSHVKLLVLPENIYSISQGFTYVRSAEGANVDQPTATLSVTYNNRKITLPNVSGIIDEIALLFVPTEAFELYDEKEFANNPENLDKLADIALLYSENGDIYIDQETNTIEVAIDNDTNLGDLVNLVNSGAEIADVVLLKLTDNIDLTDDEWKTIGTANVPFNGSFDGQNFTITLGNGNEDEQADVTTIFGTIGEDGKVENVNIEGVNYEVGTETVGIEIDNKQYYSLLAAVNNGTISNVVVTGSVQAEEADANNTIGCLVADNQGTLDHIVGYFEKPEADGNKRCILVSQNVGVGRNAGKASKTCANTGSNRALPLQGSTPRDIDEDVRIFSDEEMASGEPAYWLNWSQKGYTGEYTEEWSTGEKYPVLADAQNRPTVKLVYEIDDATAEEVGISSLKYYANEGDKITIHVDKLPNALKVNGIAQSLPTTGTDIELTITGTAANDGTITIELNYGATAVNKINANGTTQISATGKRINISNAAGKQYSIYNIRGAEVLSGTIEANTKQIIIPEIGIYVVKVGNTKQKVVVR